MSFRSPNVFFKGCGLIAIAEINFKI